MRRCLSIFLVLFFALGPLTLTLPADDDLRLPPCCRRHGAHHCAMAAAMIARMEQAASGKPIVSSPAHCPFYPHNTGAMMAPVHALTPSLASLPVLIEQPHALSAFRPAAIIRPIRARAGRGPPVSNHS